MFNALYGVRLSLALIALLAGQHVALAQPRGQLARLVENTDTSSGLPPFALTDQAGTIQRYVEPVPGVDLAPHVGQVIVVRHDTGRILLASQLELPLSSVSGVGYQVSERRLPTPDAPAANIQQAQYADDDDATVELLNEGAMLPGTTPQPQGYPLLEAPSGAGGYPVFPGDQPSYGVGPAPGTPYYDPMTCGSPVDIVPQANYGGMPYTDGVGHFQGGQDPGLGYTSPYDPTSSQPMHIYGALEINFVRPHVAEGAVGKLSEKYEFSPRFIFGFTGLGPIDGRARYWIYGRDNPTLDADSLRLEFDVLDLEATHEFRGPRSEALLAAGLRAGRIDLIDSEGHGAGADVVGLTLAADGRTRLVALDGDALAWVYGGRLSILGADWTGDSDLLLNGVLRDDNLVVHELYVGIELTRRYRDVNLHARLAFEMQNWHSDVLSERIELGSIGFIAPGIRVGAEF